MAEITLLGKLVVASYGENDWALCLTEHGRQYGAEPVAELLEGMHNRLCSVRYYVSNERIDPDTIVERYLSALYGNVQARYDDRYSEITGYLWTDEELNVGGHDLLAELETSAGKYLYLVAEVEEVVHD